jgi:tetratricopeptide (TPR) repeat protein
MKAERRHELQTNTLAKALQDLPLYLRFHGNKILVGVIVLCVLVLLFRHRMNSAKENSQLSATGLTSARMGVNQLRVSDQMLPTEIARAEQRRTISNSVSQSIDDILNNTSDPDDAAIRAQALLLRGDLNWELANLPKLAGASTMPALALPQEPSQYLDTAAAAYEQVLSQYNDQKMAKGSALFGLAAIAENRGNWDNAIERYQAITKDEAIPQSFRNLAQQRLAMIPQIRKPVYIGTFSSTQPTTEPSTMESIVPFALPTTAPATAASPEPTTAPQ